MNQATTDAVATAAVASNLTYAQLELHPEVPPAVASSLRYSESIDLSMTPPAMASSLNYVQPVNPSELQSFSPQTD